MREETLKKYKNIPKGKYQKHAGFAAMTEDLDDSLGLLFDKIEEFTKHQNSEPYVLSIKSNDSDFEKNIKEVWPKTKDKNGNCRYVNRSFSFWRKNNVIYFNTWGPGSNNPPAKDFSKVEKILIKNFWNYFT